MYYQYGDLVTEAFVAGLPDLYKTVKEYPELRMVPIARVDAVRDGLKQLGYSMIYDKPVIGANHCLVNFIHPKSTGGVLIEIATSQK
jgi:hypothetical protein